MKDQESLTLREYVEHLHGETLRQIAELAIAQNEKLRNALDASNRAIEKAEDSTNKRLDLLNEFRAQVADQTANFVGREAYDAQSRAAENKITAMEATAVASRRALTIGFSIATLLIGIIAVALPIVLSHN